MKEVAEREAEAGVKFNIIETAGLSMRRVLQVSNPLESAGCTSPACLPCKNGRGVTVGAVGQITKLNASFVQTMRRANI